MQTISNDCTEEKYYDTNLSKTIAQTKSNKKW
jgi:hypothetical protein